MPAPLPPADLLTVAEVARSFDVSTRTVRRWMRDGLLVACRIGRTVRVHPDDLARFIKANRTIRP